MSIILFFIILAALIFAFRFISDKLYSVFNRNEEDQPVQQQKVKTKSKNDKSISPELVAVITAAACEVLDQKIVVKKIRFIDNDSDLAWKRAGRLNIMSSHTVQHKNRIV